jgi:hypothetical protein
MTDFFRAFRRYANNMTGKTIRGQQVTGVMLEILDYEVPAGVIIRLHLDRPRVDKSASYEERVIASAFDDTPWCAETRVLPPKVAMDVLAGWQEVPEDQWFLDDECKV